MLFKFADDTTLEIRGVFGSTSNFGGVSRDMLKIEIDPESCDISIGELKDMFSDGEKMKLVRLITDPTEDNPEGVESIVGEHYTIFRGISYDVRDVVQDPGVIALPETIEVIVVTVVQKAYTDLVLDGIGELIDAGKSVTVSKLKNLMKESVSSPTHSGSTGSSEEA